MEGGICTSERGRRKQGTNDWEGDTQAQHHENKKDMKGIYHPSLDDRVREGGREKKGKAEKRKDQEEDIVQTLLDVTANGVGRTRILFVFDFVWET